MTRYEQWQAPDFAPLALRWVDEALAVRGLRRSGPPTWSRVRPWGHVLSVATEDGVPVWFKATPEGSAEVALHTMLAAEVPDRVAPVLGADEDRGWLLLGDLGPSLGDDVDPDDAGEACARPGFRAAMTTYAQVQGRVTHRIDDLVARGLPDARQSAMPAVFDLVLDDLTRAAVDSGDRSARALLGRIAQARPVVVDLAASLHGQGSVDHNDLHPWNVMAPGGGRCAFLDWGDAMAAHPLASLLVPVRIALTHSRPSAAAVLTAYEEGTGAPLDLDALDAALRLAVVGRAWTWLRSIASDPDPGEYADAPLTWFARILDPSPLGPDRD